MIKTVHVVFKTHLDVGFTGYASEVIARYETDYIPKAIALAEELDASNQGGAFVWTTGSWMINHALETGTPEQVAALENAINKGYIAWHGLPLSTHTEAMDPLLFEYGLSISARLDARFGKTTIAGKMTDVPGHTIGMVPLLVRAGIKYLHIGVNRASAVPEVPAAFVWRSADGSELIVNYDADYGAAAPGIATTMDGCESGLYIAHTNDNTGPPTPEEVRGLFTLLSAKYPDAAICASTLSAFAEDAVAARDLLPVVTDEIGDTWIHGIASDPLLLSQFRELQRLRSGWVATGRMNPGDDVYNAFSDPLLLVAEHTFGEDLKSFLPDFENYSKVDFNRARAADQIDPRKIPAVHGFLAQWTDRPKSQGYSYSAFEQSWLEQRDRIGQALESLDPELRADADQALAGLLPEDAPAGLTQCEIGRTFRLGRFDVEFNGDGSIGSLIDARGVEWAGPGNPIGSYSYQSFGIADFERWIGQYCRDLDENGYWALSDFGKIGFENVRPRPINTVFRPTVHRISFGPGDGCEVVHVEMGMSSHATEILGAPRRVRITYRFDSDEPTVVIALALQDKDANRLPEASWFAINPRVQNPNHWLLRKMGSCIDPSRVVRGGNRNLHAVQDILSYDDGTSLAEIDSLDAPLVAIGEPRILSFDRKFADPAGGIHVNLHNNVWGTNFRMWFDDDIAFRFKLRFDSVQPLLNTKSNQAPLGSSAWATQT